MSLHHSPKIVTDGLVFAYDVANTKKSWKGAPTTNLYADGDYSSGVLHPVRSGLWSIVEDPRNSRGKVLKVSPAASNQYHGRDITAVVSSVYSISVDVYASLDCDLTNFRLYGEQGAGGVSIGYNFANKGTWQRFVFNGKAATATNMRVLMYALAAFTTGFLLISNMQVELEAFATPFVNGTRTNTQAILDLTSNTTITATNLTYSSDGSFSFDGGTTSASISNNFSYTNGFSFDVMLYPTGAGGNSYGRILDKTTSTGSNQGVFLYVNAAPIVTFGINNTGGISGTVPYNTWTHLCVTASSLGAAMMYVNGVLISTGATGLPSAITNTNFLTIGNRSTATDRGFVGNISTVKIYNRAITATEVQQNFQALRSRYEI